MNLNNLLKKAYAEKVSDVHICVGVPPIFRIDGKLVDTNEQIMSPQDCVSVAKQCLNQKTFETFLEIGEVDVSYALSGVCRFRVNVFKQRGTCAVAFRIISTDTPRMENLGLPDVMTEFAEKRRGLFLVTGPTGSGKTTTLAAMIDYINRTRREHIITVEDPIEYTFSHNNSVINQREIGIDTRSFANSLRAALREDPDVILVGEMRDEETVSTALTAAETGHFVLSTLHTVGAAKTIDRIVDVFSPHQQSQIRSQISTVLTGIVSQQLLPKANSVGRVVATEVMIMTPAIANLIRDGKTPQINTCIQTGSQLGMHSMDSYIAQLYKSDVIDYYTACSYAVDVDNLKKILAI